jgi:hypothetical protein
VEQVLPGGSGGEGVGGSVWGEGEMVSKGIGG